MQDDPFPGQLTKASFTLDQVRCLASSARAEVFWSFSATDPRSIGEVAEGLGRSASATTYHVAELVEVGLLIAAGVRKRRSRIEKLYVLGSRSYISHGFRESEEYRALLLEGFAAQQRLQLRERKAASEALLLEPDLIECVTYRRFQARVPRERAVAFKAAVLALFQEFLGDADEEETMLMSVSFSISPSLIESRRRTGKARKPSPRTKPKD